MKEKKGMTRRFRLSAGFLLVLTFLCYFQATRFTYIWDDQDYILENPTLRNLNGLKRIWFDFNATPQYYPLVHSFFWVEYHLWGLSPSGYHVVNILLHGLNAVLFFLVLSYLGIPWPWFGAAIFALHPVHVESVAWITERKNVLSLFFYLLSANFYLRFRGLKKPESSGNRSPHPAFYPLSLFCFILALLSKTVSCSLPAALLLIVYFKRGKLEKKDIWRMIPFFILGLGFGILTIGMERHQVGAEGEFWNYTFIERCLIAGRAIWFYMGKLIFPYPLIFVYPRWNIDSSHASLFLFPLGVICACILVWVLRRKIGRGPVVAYLFFCGTLFPALGFFNIYPMRYSLVADHFQYHASLGLIALFAGGMGFWAKRLREDQKPQLMAGAAILCLVLGFLTWKQSLIYRDFNTLFKATLKKNPDSPFVVNTAAAIISEEGDKEEAINLYQKALLLEPEDDVAHFNIGKIYLEKGDIEKAIKHLEEANRMTPECAHYHYFLGLGYAMDNRLEPALIHFQKAVTIDPKEPFQRYNYGLALMNLGKFEEAIPQFAEAIKARPDFLKARLMLVDSLMQPSLKRIEEAEKALEEGLQIDTENGDLKMRMPALQMIKREMEKEQKK